MLNMHETNSAHEVVEARRVTLTVEILGDWEKFALLEREWNPLLWASRANTLFLTWEWITAWAQANQKRHNPFVVCVRGPSGELLGIAPYYTSLLRFGGVLPYRTLRIMADHATGAEYADWIINPGNETEVAQLIASTLARARGCWDCLWMPNIAGWTGAIDRILLSCQTERFLSCSRTKEFGAVELPDAMDTYIRSLSSNKRQQLRGEMKRIKGQPGVIIRRCETADQIPQFLEALFDLHHRRWRTREEEGSFHRKPQLVEFYKQFVPRAYAKGWLWLFALEDRGEFKAVQLGYVYNSIYHQIQEGFDPEYTKGVGNVLRAGVIEACIAAGLRTFDFLGEMSEHKRRWHAKVRDGCDLFIGHRKLKNLPLFSAGIWPTGRFLRPAV